MEEGLIAEVEALQIKLMEKEHISFNALVRKLIRIGLDNFKE